MKRLALSDAGTGLYRALLARGKIPRDRILLSTFRSTDWQSLTFVGERHEIFLRIPGPNADTLLHWLIDDLEHAEFTIPGHCVADILVSGDPQRHEDGSISVELNALTIAD